jgi:hypothetical protein
MRAVTLVSEDRCSGNIVSATKQLSMSFQIEKELARNVLQHSSGLLDGLKGLTALVGFELALILLPELVLILLPKLMCHVMMRQSIYLINEVLGNSLRKAVPL